MDDLTYTLKRLCRRNRDGSHATQADRMHSLTMAARQLADAGFRQMRATSLKGRHVEALVGRWQEEGLSAGTMKNRLSHIRWWAEKIGKPGLIPADNAKLTGRSWRLIANPSRSKSWPCPSSATIFWARSWSALDD